MRKKLKNDAVPSLFEWRDKAKEINDIKVMLGKRSTLIENKMHNQKVCSKFDEKTEEDKDSPVNTSNEMNESEDFNHIANITNKDSYFEVEECNDEITESNLNETETVSDCIHDDFPSSGNIRVSDIEDTVLQNYHTEEVIDESIDEKDLLEHDNKILYQHDIKDHKTNSCSYCKVKDKESVDAKVAEKLIPPNIFEKGFSIEKYQYRNDAVHFYTGLETYEKFLLVYSLLGPAVDKLNYFYMTPPKHITPLNRFFLTLIRLREKKTYFELSLMFETTIKQVSNIFLTWIRFMKLQWDKISQWPSKDLVKFYAPHDFKTKYPRVRIILNGTEIPIKKPTAQQSNFSHYKNKNTVKDLFGSTTGGLYSYTSEVYGGSASDRQLVERSDLSKKLEPGDSVMADKDFDIEDILAAYRVTLNIPTFFRKSNQITPEALAKDRKIASKRVHIERLIGSAKTYKILNGPLESSEIILIDDIITVCVMLCNLRKPIVNKYA